MRPSPLLRPFVAIILVGLLSAPAFAADEPTLKVGDAAPKLSIQKWVKGEPVKELEKGRVYVVEFWATWCPPCVTAMPHLSALQKQYKDKGVTFIGVNIWERDRSKVEPFVESQGDRMAYRVAIEEPIEGSPTNGRMATDWMSAAGRRGIPASFIVDQNGKIAWIGHPMRMDRPLEAIVAGKFDAKAYAARAARIDAVTAEAMAATKAKDYDKALELRDALIEVDPDDADMHRLHKLSLYKQKGDEEKVAAMADEILASAERKKDARMAGNVAFYMMQERGGKPDPVRALKAAQVAYELGDKSSPFQRLLGQAHAANGQYDKAIELQEKVVAQMTGPAKARDQKLLEDYKSKK